MNSLFLENSVKQLYISVPLPKMQHFIFLCSVGSFYASIYKWEYLHKGSLYLLCQWFLKIQIMWGEGEMVTETWISIR